MHQGIEPNLLVTDGQRGMFNFNILPDSVYIVLTLSRVGRYEDNVAPTLVHSILFIFNRGAALFPTLNMILFIEG